MNVIANPGREFDPRAVTPGSPADRLLRSFWQPVFIGDRLPAGKAMPLHILGEDFTLFRGRSGKPQVLAPYCAHRGSRLNTGWVEDDCLRCFYHGWKYAGDGSCVEQPAEKGEPDKKVKIASYPTREYLGLIFVYFGIGEPPELPHFNAYHRDGFIDHKQSHRKWSYFDQLENSVDEVHFNFVHRKSKFTDVGLNDEIPELTCVETDYGILRIGKRGNRTRKSHILMPNCMYSMTYEHYKGWTEHLSWRVPVDEDSHTSFIVECVHKEGDEAAELRRLRAEHRKALADLEPADRLIDRIIAGEMHIDDVTGRPDIVLLQDGVAMKGLRKPRDASMDQLRASDRQVLLLRRLWRRELDAIVAGNPIKQWKVPPELVPTTGTELDA
ncbi:MAG TPA: Rieske 2Fe-2S domain-containing protein [Beijerinckiaceae bacterium]|nr:Rieske 2Fe-2S domain-containing protein [Beijerinckiaceae bacterium]